MQTALSHFWELVSGAIALSPNAFQQLVVLPGGSILAFFIVFLAGFSQAIGQGIILFANRVKPLRFILSLIIAALLFAIGVLFWGLSTWFVSEFIYRQYDTSIKVTLVVGLSFAPQLFSVFIALPYLGVPIATLLSVWSFVAYLVGMSAVFNLTFVQAFSCGVLGWAGLQLLQRTIGRPFTQLSRWLSNTAAGVNLVTDLKELERLVEQGIQPSKRRRY